MSNGPTFVSRVCPSCGGSFSVAINHGRIYCGSRCIPAQRSSRAQHAAPGTFGDLLAAQRAAAGRSRNSLAQEVGVDAAYLTRIEQGSREAPRAHIVVALARALRVSPHVRNVLLLAAGHAPSGISTWCDALQAVGDVLNNPLLGEEEREEFEAVVCAIAARWRPSLNTIVSVEGRAS